MSRSLNALKKRMHTIRSTQKVTNSMKLISMSKLQRYWQQHHAHEMFFESLDAIEHHNTYADSPRLLVCIVPDLGLVSAYTKAMRAYISKENDTTLMWLGHQHYDALLANPMYTILNEKVSSEKMISSEIIKELLPLKNKYNIVVLKASLTQRTSLRFESMPLFNQLVEDDAMLYEPNFKDVSEQFEYTYAQTLLEHVRLSNKVSEHKLRQIAMDEAYNNAEDMHEELQLDYHQLRQEKITQEIAEIVAGKDVSL